MSAYCDLAPAHAVHASYHATEYGFPVADERVLFERLALEIMQAGLSWETVLKKRIALNSAFDSFHVDAVAVYDAHDIDRLLADARIIRNRLKIRAIISNAIRIQDMRASHGGFAMWLRHHHPRSKDEWVRLFRKTFAFTGPEITGEFLMSIGLLSGAHRSDCPVYERIQAQNPPWMHKVIA